MNASSRKHVDGLRSRSLRSAQATASGGTPVAGNRRAALVAANGGALSVLVVAAAAFALLQTHGSSGRQTWPWGWIGPAAIVLFAAVGAFGWVTLRLMGGRWQTTAQAFAVVAAIALAIIALYAPPGLL